MHKILVFSDSHVQSETQSEPETDVFISLEAGIRHASRFHADAECLIHLGDVTANGLPEEYARIDRLLRRTSFDFILIPGNHDNREAMCASLPAHVHADEDAGGFLQSVRHIGNSMLLFLVTLSDGAPGIAGESGCLCPVRLEWLMRRLEEPRNGNIVIFMHHPPCRVGMDILDELRLVNGSSLLPMLDQLNTSVHLVFGHVHRSVSGSWGPHGYTACRGSAVAFPLTTLSESEIKRLQADPFSAMQTEPPAYMVVHLFERSIALHTQPYPVSNAAVLRHDTP